MISGFSQIPAYEWAFGDVNPPDVLADCSRVEGETAHKKARNLLAATGVAAVAGSAFFTQGKGESILRFCFGKKPEALESWA